MPAGVVLAGGYSTRFGDGDKALADLAGVPMIRRVADRVRPAVESLVVNCRADQREAIADALAGYDRPVEFALDPEPDEGPTAGMAVGLRAVGSTYAAVLACDMPFADPDLLTYLFERAERADADAVVPRPGEWFETTHAVYRADAMAAACEAALARGERRTVAALAGVECVTVGPDELADFDPDSFESLDTRREFEAAADRLG